MNYFTQMVNLMKVNTKERLPQWYNDTTQYGLILTDDIDSLLGCSILKTVKGWDIERLMLFNYKKQGIDFLAKTRNATHESIGVDFAMVNGKCFDNHLCRFSYNDDMVNKESINLNNITNVARLEYYKKYNLSTVLLLWSLYDLPKEDLLEELMMVLIAIDGSYEGFYTKDFFRQIHKRYMVDYLELPEFYECELRHTKQEFEEIKRKYNLDKKITVHKGNLSTEIDIDAINELLAWECDVQIELPAEQFYLEQKFNSMSVDIKGNPNSIKTICENPFSYALTAKFHVNYSEPIENI